MNRRLLIILLCAFVVAAGASILVYRLIRKQVSNGGSVAKVVVAARDLEIGTLIKPADLKMGELGGRAPDGVALKIESAVGRGVISKLYTGEPIQEKRLAAVGSGGGLAATIPPGMRACAVKVNEVVGVAGFVVPGMRVDVLISGHPPGTDNSSGSKVRTVLQNIEVLSAGTNFQKDAEGKPVQVQVVNLLVNPEQAELLSLASSNETRIQLVLRNPLDQQVAQPPGTEMAKLFGAAAPNTPVRVAPRAAVARKALPKKEEKPQPPPTFVIQVINGAKSTEQKFPLPEGDRP